MRGNQNINHLKRKNQGRVVLFTLMIAIMLRLRANISYLMCLKSKNGLKEKRFHSKNLSSSFLQILTQCLSQSTDTFISYEKTDIANESSAINIRLTNINIIYSIHLINILVQKMGFFEVIARM